MVQANEGEEVRLEWLIKKAQEAGMLRSGDVMHLRYLFIGTATSVFTLAEEYQFMSKQDPFHDDFVEKHVEMVLSLFLTPVDQ